MNLKICIFFLWQVAHCQLSPITNKNLQKRVYILTNLIKKPNSMNNMEIEKLQNEIETIVHLIEKLCFQAKRGDYRRRTSR